MIGLLNNVKFYLIVAFGVALIVLGVFLGRGLRKPDVVIDPVYSRIEDIKHVRHLELVSYYFESMVDVTHLDKTDKVYLLLVIPARVSCYIDLDQMHYTSNDTLVRLSLPDPIIEAPVLDLDSAQIFNMNQRYVTASKKSYETVVRNVQLSLTRAKQDVLCRAMANGIQEEARRLGEAYFRSLFTGLGLEVEFIVL